MSPALPLPTNPSFHDGNDNISPTPDNKTSGDGGKSLHDTSSSNPENYGPREEGPHLFRPNDPLNSGPENNIKNNSVTDPP